MITFKHHSGIHTLEVEQFISSSMEKAWDFFSNPQNLQKITPGNMGFEITSCDTGRAYPGQIITYKVKIFPLIKSNWVTEITQVKENKYFIDEQRFGPYKMWHHEHHFKQVDNGILIIDRVSYKIPFGIIGKIFHSIFIKSKLKFIFQYRYNFIVNYF